jgi:DNA oxidative demethylase
MTLEPSDRELGVVLVQLERLGARLVAVGHGRDPRSRRAAELFVAAWTAGLDPDGDPREVAEVVDWPVDAASWLRPARRLTETAVDGWVIADQGPGWKRMSARLRESTDWDPARTVAFAGLDSPAIVAAAEPGALDGMLGATAEGGLWFIEGSTLRRHTPRAVDSAPGELFPRPPVEIAPGAVHVPGWLDFEQQRRLVQACREWSQGPAPMRHTELPRGGQMSVQTVCLGWHWTPYRYTRTAIDQGDAPVTPFPDWLGDLARRAVADAYGGEEEAASYRPDAALINFYDETAKLGMHQDKDERSGAPVVSLSIGDTCTFRFGNTADRGAPYTDVELRSGDLFVFGGPSRFAYHGVANGTQAGTGDPSTGLDGGRLNLTLRETGLADPRDL